MYKEDQELGIKYFDEGEVYLISKTSTTGDIKEYMQDYGLTLPEERGGDFSEDNQFIPEFAGRHCYMSFGDKLGTKTNEDYLSKIIKHKHFSVLEHLSFGFVFRGFARSFSHEIVRHRHLSFSQFSTRYCDDIKFVVPHHMRDDEETKKLFLKKCARDLQSYNNAYKRMYARLKKKNRKGSRRSHLRKAARGCVRALLPIASEAPIVVSGNLRAWRETIEKRDSEHADIEIREAIRKVRKILEEEVPNGMLGLPGG